jgi:hypothetical protein
MKKEGRRELEDGIAFKTAFKAGVKNGFSCLMRIVDVLIG